MSDCNETQCEYNESDIDLQNWMGRLPMKVRQRVPIIYLAIPGTHNSMTYGITRSSKIAPDADESVRRLNRVFPVIVRRWSKNQKIDVNQQLTIGIRYLDLRIAFNKKQNDYYYAHGLFANSMKEPLLEIDEFLSQHPYEFVILDFQHFYNIDSDQHNDIQKIIFSIFGSKIVTIEDGRLEDFTLDYCRKINKQILVIYRRHFRELTKIVWPGNIWPTPWPNKASKRKLEGFLNQALETRQPGTGFVSQCIITPDPKYIMLRFFLSLKWTAKRVETYLQPWISTQKAGTFHGSGRPTVNVFIADFVEINQGEFCKLVVGLNNLL